MNFTLEKQQFQLKPTPSKYTLIGKQFVLASTELLQCDTVSLDRQRLSRYNSKQWRDLLLGYCRVYYCRRDVEPPSRYLRIVAC